MLGIVGVRYGAVWQAGLGGFQHGGVRSGMAGTAGCGTTGSSVAWWGWLGSSLVRFGRRG